LIRPPAEAASADPLEPAVVRLPGIYSLPPLGRSVRRSTARELNAGTFSPAGPMRTGFD
jgi:hypothetical protein